MTQVPPLEALSQELPLAALVTDPRRHGRRPPLVAN